MGITLSILYTQSGLPLLHDQGYVPKCASFVGKCTFSVGLVYIGALLRNTLGWVSILGGRVFVLDVTRGLKRREFH